VVGGRKKALGIRTTHHGSQHPADMHRQDARFPIGDEPNRQHRLRWRRFYRRTLISFDVQ